MSTGSSFPKRFLKPQAEEIFYFREKSLEFEHEIKDICNKEKPTSTFPFYPDSAVGRERIFFERRDFFFKRV